MSRLFDATFDAAPAAGDEMRYGELFKNFDAREISTEPNPCVKTWGMGPAGMRCKHCQHLKALKYANTYYKCAKRGRWTHGPSTDHRVNWKACAKFEPLPGMGGAK